jgi:hypothetical protein
MVDAGLEGWTEVMYFQQKIYERVREIVGGSESMAEKRAGGWRWRLVFR